MKITKLDIEKLAELNATIAELTKKAEAIKVKLKAAGPGTYEGKAFKAVVAERETERHGDDHAGPCARHQQGLERRDAIRERDTCPRGLRATPGHGVGYRPSPPSASNFGRLRPEVPRRPGSARLRPA